MINLKLILYIIATISIVLLYNIGVVFSQVYCSGGSFTTSLWNPYILGGMPSFATGHIGFTWWDQIQIFIDATTIIASRNPLWFIAFLLSCYWLFISYKDNKRVWNKYVLVLVTEMIMIFTTNWCA